MPRKRKRKPLCHKNGSLIGIDESNNGFSYCSCNPFHNSRSYVTIAGYFMTHDQHLEYNSKNKESKKGVFRDFIDVDEGLIRAKDFLEENPDFYYLSISKAEAQKTDMHTLRARAAATIALKFLSDYDVDPEKTTIVMDDLNKYQRNHLKRRMHKLPQFTIPTDKDSFSYRVNKKLDQIFCESGITTRHLSRENADKEISAVIKADLVAFYLSALNFCGNEKEWYYDHRRLDLKDLDSLVKEVASCKLI
ncbi:hypothetical protein GOV14_02275 [Candidatus Pacearchaeota archaeon]|nr:hypothetical protein [Candidatus Pacearchaeota archaeon]